MANRYIGELGTDVYGITADESRVAHLFWDEAAAAAADDDGMATAAAPESTADLEVTEFLAQPPCARGLIITPSATAKAGTIKIYGEDIGGNKVAEEISLTAAATAKKTAIAYRKVDKIVLPKQDAEQTFKIGWEDRLGLPYAFDVKPLVFALFGGTLETTAPTLAINADPAKNTIDLNSALTGLTGKTVDVFFVL